MGCGISKFDRVEAVGPICKFNPILKPRIEKISPGRESEPSVIMYSNLSFKQFLDDGGGDPLLVKKGSDDGFVKEAGALIMEEEENVKVIDVDDKSRVKNVCENEKNRDQFEGKEEVEVAAATVADKEEVLLAVNDNDEERKEDGRNYEKEEEGCSDREDYLIGPGSPSFREYCHTDQQTFQEDFSGMHYSDGAKVENELQRKENIASTQLAKKYRKGRKFGRVMPRGSPVAVKNLWNVTTCYNNNATYGRDKQQKLAGKETERET